MEQKRTIQKNINSALFGLLIFIILILIPARTDLFDGEYARDIKDFSGEWILQTGDIVDADTVSTYAYGGAMTLEKTFPDDVDDGDSLCFASKNVDLSVVIDGRKVYEFTSKENLTGLGYGTAFHDVGLCKDDAGKTVKIVCTSIGERNKNCRIYDVCLGPAGDYVRKNIRLLWFPALVSVLTAFFGIAIAIVYACLPNRNSMPINMLALAGFAGLSGTWLLLETNILQLMTGVIYVWRDMSRILVFLLMYPIVAFFNSLTEQKRQIYDYVAFALSMVFIFGIVITRYAAGIDMIDSFSWFLVAYTALAVIQIWTIKWDNSNYCKAFGVKSEMRAFFLGMLLLMIAVIVDSLTYFLSNRTLYCYGNFTRLGVLLFLFIMLYIFLKWWTKDHREIERDRFINHALQFAVSSDSPEISIRALIDYLGTEFNARRFFIFEDQKNGKFRGTYEWFRKGEKSVDLDIMYIPYAGVVDKLYETFNKNGHRLIIDDIEQYKTANPAFYNILNINHVDNMVMGPLEVNGNLIGVCGVLGAPEDTLESISEIIGLLSYFFAQLILQREEQKRMFYYSYNDGLSGARNHRAYRKFVEGGLDKTSAFGYMRMNIAGLADINKRMGYEAGDKIVFDVAKCLMEVFGDENVYRINGTEFITLGFETEEEFFKSDVERVRRMIREMWIDVNIGAVYCLHGTKDLSIVAERVKELMEEDAEKMEAMQQE